MARNYRKIRQIKTVSLVAFQAVNPPFYWAKFMDENHQIIQVNASDPTKFLQAIDTLPGTPPTDLEAWLISYFKDFLTPSPSLRGVIFRFVGLMGIGGNLALIIEAGKAFWQSDKGWWLALFIALILIAFALLGRWLSEYHFNFKFLYLSHCFLLGIGFFILGAIAIWG